MLRVCLSIMMGIVCASLCVPAFAKAPTEPGPLLIVGDSLSAGYGISLEASWPNLLQQKLREEGYSQTVVNASISGETTSGGARRINALLSDHAPSVVVIALGANDGLRGTDPGETRRNLETMIRATRASGATVVLTRVRIPPNYGPAYTAQFEQIYDDLAAVAGVIDAPFMLEQFAADSSAFQADGLHPVASAQPRILATLWPSLRSSLEPFAVPAHGTAGR